MCLCIGRVSGPHICPPLLLDVEENVVQLIQLLIRVLWFRVNGNHHQVLQHYGGHTKHAQRRTARFWIWMLVLKTF